MPCRHCCHHLRPHQRLTNKNNPKHQLTQSQNMIVWRIPIFFEPITVDNEGLVSTIQVVEVFGCIREADEYHEKEMKRHKDNYNDAVTTYQIIANQRNTVTPGGQSFHASSNDVKFIYDGARIPLEIGIFESYHAHSGHWQRTEAHQCGP